MIEKKLNKRSLAAKKGWETRRAKSKSPKLVKVAKADIKDALLNKKVKGINKFFDDLHTAQIYTSGLEYAWVSENLEQCHTFAFCKDFLHDAVWASWNKTSVSIWSFNYVFGKNPPVDLNRIRVALRLKEKDNPSFEQYCKNILSFMNLIEDEMGVERSTMSYGGPYTGTSNDIWVITGSPVWMRSPYHMSAFTLLLRVGMTYKNGTWQDHMETGERYGKNDEKYISSAKKGIMEIVKDKKLALFAKNPKDNFPPEVGTHTLHNNGIVTYSRGAVNDAFKKFW